MLRFNAIINYISNHQKQSEKYQNVSVAIDRERCVLHVNEPEEKQIQIMAFDVQSIPDVFIAIEGFIPSDGRFDLVCVTLTIPSKNE